MGLSPLALGAIILVLGMGIFLLTWILPRLLSPPGKQPLAIGSDSPTLPLDISRHTDAVLLVQAGGRVVYSNLQARQMLDLVEGELNLDHLGRRARPSEAFWSLCAAEGQSRFLMDGRVVEGTSYGVPYGAGRAMLVTLRRPQLIAPRQDNGAAQVAVPPVGGLNVLAEVNQAMTSSLDLDATVRAILASVERLVPADSYELSLWDSESQALIPFRLVGSADAGRRLEKSAEAFAASLGYPEALATQRQALLIPDVDADVGQSSPEKMRAYPFKSYLGIPLEVGGDLVGVLELHSLDTSGLGGEELELLRLLTRQAALAIHNASLYEKEEKRAHELAGLAKLARVVSAQHELKELYARLVEAIGSLLDVEVLGFWIYDEENQALKGQVPFQGVQPSVIEWTQVDLKTGSPALGVWQAGELIQAGNAPDDPRIQVLGLEHLARAAGIQRTVLVPLATSGRGLGYLQVANKKDGSAFDPSDIRLLIIIAGQVAAIIENAELVKQSRRRAQRAEMLRRIASLTASSATLDEILKFSLQDVGRLLQADMAIVFLLDESKGELRLHKQSMLGVSPEVTVRLGRLAVDDPQVRGMVTSSQQPVMAADAPAEKDVTSIYQVLATNLKAHSLMVAPLTIREHSIGEMILMSREQNFFRPADLQTIHAAAGQLAGAIERARLYTQTDESLRRRLDQLTSLTRISRELNTTLELEHLLQLLLDETVLTTGADCGTIQLFELGSGELQEGARSPQVMMQFGCTATDGLQGLERLVLERGDTLIVNDFSPLQGVLQAIKAGSSLAQPPHDGIQSAMVVPIGYQEQIAGLIHLHSRSPFRFDDTARDIAETLAIQAAIALGNAHRYQDQVHRNELLNRRVETLSKLFETTQTSQLELPLEQSLENIAYAIQAATPFDVVLFSVYDAGSQVLQRLACAGLSLAEMEELRDHPQAWSAVQNVLKPEFRVGGSYFIPYEQMPVMPPDVHTLTVLSLEGLTQADEGSPGMSWHPEDVLVCPLYNAQGQPLGLLSVDAPRDRLRPDRPAIEALEIFASQAALVIESRSKLARLEEQIKVIQRELDRAHQADETGQSHLPALLRKDLQQATAIRSLSQGAERIRAGIEIAEDANRQKDRLSVLNSVGSGLLSRLEIDSVLVVEPGHSGPRLLLSLGEIPPGVNLDALLGQANPLLDCLQTGELLLVPRLDGTSWSDSRLLQALDADGFMCFPLRSAGVTDSVLLGVSRTPLESFSADDEQVILLLARQVGMTMENLLLLSETSQRLAEVNLLLDFNRRLQGLDPAGAMQSLAESALQLVPASQAVMAALWDERQKQLLPAGVAGFSVPDALKQISFRPGEALPGRVLTSGETLILKDVDFARHYNLSAENLLLYRNATAGKLPVSTLAMPVAASEGAPPLGVIVLDNYSTPSAFGKGEKALVTLLAQQAALNLENTRLVQAAEERAGQLQALTGVAATITSNLRPDELIGMLLDLLADILPFDTGTLWLRQSEREMVVQAARGFADDEQRIGLVASFEDSALISAMIASGEPIAVEDVRQDARFPTLVEPNYLSWLGVPLIVSGEVSGVIAAEKVEAGFFTPERVQIASAFAAQAAVALENAHLYQESLGRSQELIQRSQRLNMLNRLSAALSASLEPDRILEVALQELKRALRASGVCALLLDRDGAPVLQSEFPSVEVVVPVRLPETPLFNRLRETLGAFNTEDVAREAELAPLSAFLNERGVHSMLALTMAAGTQVWGFLLAYSDRSTRFSAEEIGLARTISNQASIAIQNARLYAETRDLSQDLEKRVVERTYQLDMARQRTETLLGIITELTTSLDLEQVLNRTLKLINQIVDAGQITVLIARSGEKKLHRLASLGYAGNTTIGGSVTSLDVDQGLAGWVIQSRQSTLVADVQEDPRWILLGDAHEQHRSAMAVPLMVGAECLGVLLLYHQEVGHFSADQLELVQATANQVAVAINNAELYRLIRDQAEDLGQMFRHQQEEASRSRAILEAVADGVLVTDASKNITLFNASAEQILGLQRARVIGKSLDHFIGLFGRAGQPWSETIHTWSQDPGSYEPGDLYAEQITLEDGRVVSVQLSPVSMRDSLLGTVSTFRDITHQVQLDRLKSEFVATVSHELRTPMTSIKGYVDIMLMGAAGALTPQQVEFLEIVRSNSERLAVLVNDLLDISRLESGRVTLSLQPLDLEQVALEAVSELRTRAETERKPMRIEIERSQDLQPILGDPERVRQIFDNLLENAFSYTAPHGEVLLRLQVAGEYVQVDVQDNGIGIALDAQPRIFERFYRGEHPYVLATSGTGLGLSIVKHLVEMHQGRIWFESSGIQGEGCTFSFTLPIKAPEEPKTYQPQVAARKRRAELRTGVPKI